MNQLFGLQHRGDRSWGRSGDGSLIRQTQITGGRRFRHGGWLRPPFSLSPTVRETNFRKKNDLPRFGKRIFERKMTFHGPGNGFLKEK